MALDINPGPGCESLCSLADADRYHEGRGNNAWPPLEPTRKEQLLRTAYDYMLGLYAPRWPAELAFGAVDDLGEVPPRVRDACARLALYALEGPLDGERAPQVVEETVGPLTTKYAKLDPVPEGDNRRSFPDVAAMIGPHLVPAGNPYVAKLTRA